MGKVCQDRSSKRMRNGYCSMLRKRRSITGGKQKLRLGISFAVTSCIFLMAGCSSGNAPGGPPQPFPTPSTPAPTNIYLGTQSPGLWAVTLDNQNNLFSYQAITYPATPNAPTTGLLTHVNGVTELKLPNTAPAGYAVEIPSRAVLLRPGDMTNPLVFAIQQNTCSPLGGKVRFQQLLFFNGSHGPQPINSDGTSVFVQVGTTPFASIVANTDSSGANWQFGDPVGGFVQPELYTGTCAAKNGQATVSVQSTTTGTLPATFVVGQTGFILEDFNIQYAPWSAIGIAQPEAALTTSSIAAGNYIGFLSGTLFGAQNATQLISFGPTSGNGSILTGGLFPNDDPSQMPGQNFQLALGKQDSANPGSYPNAKLTFPDPAQLCAANANLGGVPGTDANGNPTCTASMTAIVGSAEGKFAIFSTNTQAGTLYLFQQ